MELEQTFEELRDRVWRAIADKLVRTEAVNLVAVQTQIPVGRNHLGIGRQGQIHRLKWCTIASITTL
jgi:hypothetical protein